MWVAKLRLGLVILGLSSCRRTGVVEHSSSLPKAVVVATFAPASSAAVVATLPAAAAEPLTIAHCAPQVAQEFLVDA
ncbi:MAG TPA: hypothetical protein VF294_01520, partial [Polyangiaceae bacterium]